MCRCGLPNANKLGQAVGHRDAGVKSEFVSGDVRSAPGMNDVSDPWRRMRGSVGGRIMAAKYIRDLEQ